MRNYGLVALLLIVLSPALRAQHGGVSAGRLRAAYEASVGEGGRLRQRLFFDAFPTNGEDYELIFGYHPELRDSSLYDCAADMVEAFWCHDAIPDSLFYSKVAAVTCGLRLDADAPNYWQARLESVLTRHGRDAETLIDRVASLPVGDQMRFWSFVWSTTLDDEVRSRRDFHRSYILRRHPQMVPVYDSARKLFFNGINFSSEPSPRNFPECE